MERLLRKLTDGYGDVGVVCVSCRHDVVSMRGLLSGFARLCLWNFIAFALLRLSRECHHTIHPGMYLSWVLETPIDAIVA
jgi:hypothetical protein